MISFIYDMSMYDKNDRVIRIHVALYNPSIAHAIKSESWPNTVKVFSKHTGMQKEFTFIEYIPSAERTDTWPSAEPIAIYYNQELNVHLVIYLTN